MLKKLTLENFRNITEEIEVNFSKITLLFGMNNVGKSSVVSALDILKNIDSKLDVPLITDLADYGSINNLYSKHNNKNYFKIKFNISSKQRDEKSIEKEYTLHYFTKNKKIIKNLIFKDEDNVTTELITDGEDNVSYHNIKKNKRLSKSIDSFFKIESFHHELFIKNINAINNIKDLLKKYFQFELIISNIINLYNSANPNEIQINRSDIANYLRIINSNKKYSINNFFEKIKTNENIEQLVFDKFIKVIAYEDFGMTSKQIQRNLKIYNKEDFDPFNHLNPNMVYGDDETIHSPYFNMIASTLFYMCFDDLKDEIEENLSINNGLLKAIFFYSYIEDHLKKPIISDQNINDNFKGICERINFKNYDDFKTYNKLLNQFSIFVHDLYKLGKINKKVLYENMQITPEKLSHDNLITLLGSRMFFSEDTSEFSIINIFKSIGDRTLRSSARRSGFYLDIEPSFSLRSFYRDIPFSQIYLGEDTSQRVFTYNNSNSFYDLLYLNRKNINLLTKIAGEIKNLGFDVNEIKIESLENTYRIKIISSRSTTDLIDCGKGIKRLISIFAQIYCNKVTSFKSRGGSNLICIEEPESNIHPKIQAELGSTLSHAIQQNIAGQILVETHSENLTLRLLKLVREKKLDHNDIAINCLYLDEADIVRCQKINIQENGDIVDNWPGGFFEESFSEII